MQAMCGRSTQEGMSFWAAAMLRRLVRSPACLPSTGLSAPMPQVNGGLWLTVCEALQPSRTRDDLSSGGPRCLKIAWASTGSALHQTVCALTPLGTNVGLPGFVPDPPCCYLCSLTGVPTRASRARRMCITHNDPCPTSAGAAQHENGKCARTCRRARHPGAVPPQRLGLNQQITTTELFTSAGRC